MKRNIWKFSLHRLFVIAVGLFWATTLLNITNVRPKRASDVAGLASASGTLVGVKPYTAAKIYFLNTDERILYRGTRMEASTR